jgi:hypothetical protein
MKVIFAILVEYLKLKEELPGGVKVEKKEY